MIYQRNDRHFTLDEVAQALFEEDYQEWLEGGKKGKQPKVLTTERVRQIEARALFKLKRYCKRHSLRIEDHLDK